MNMMNDVSINRDKKDWVQHEALTDIREAWELSVKLKAQLADLPRHPTTAVTLALINSLDERLFELKTFLEIEVDGVMF